MTVKSSSHFFFNPLGQPTFQFCLSSLRVSWLCTALLIYYLISSWLQTRSRYIRVDAARTRIPEDMSRDRYPLFWDVSAHAQAARAFHTNGSWADTKKTLLRYYLPRVCRGRCLTVGLLVTISCTGSKNSVTFAVFMRQPWHRLKHSLDGATRNKRD
jgi:hypothetical protein